MADRLPTSDTVAAETRHAHPIYRRPLGGWRCYCGWSGADRDLHMVEAGVEAGIAAMAELRNVTAPQPDEWHPGPAAATADRGSDPARHEYMGPLPTARYRDGSTVQADQWPWPFMIDTSGHPIIPNEVAALLCHPEAAAALAALLGVDRG